MTPSSPSSLPPRSNCPAATRHHRSLLSQRPQSWWRPSPLPASVAASSPSTSAPTPSSRRISASATLVPPRSSRSPSPPASHRGEQKWRRPSLPFICGGIGGHGRGRSSGVRPAGGQLPAVAAAGSHTAPSRTPPFTGCAARAARANPMRREARPGALARGGSERRATHGRKE
ncbi:hypothetical protein PVAP13_8KG244004 [Panicum virgatum]|uniref:Uncharacterized protein n=1 Tax=Panicum virgatum TaxID=38727 RepID=A0A8T0PRC8_PANVG|nr:hypothetical protein PVAP13_8KG244004 [Panicum virgatum]